MAFLLSLIILGFMSRASGGKYSRLLCHAYPSPLRKKVLYLCACFIVSSKGTLTIRIKNVLPIILLVQLPNVKFIDCSQIPVSGYSRCLKISFNNKVEYAGLQYFPRSDSILEGVLLDISGNEDEDSRVSVTLHEDENSAFVRLFFYTFLEWNFNIFITISGYDF